MIGVAGERLHIIMVYEPFHAGKTSSGMNAKHHRQTMLSAMEKLSYHGNCMTLKLLDLTEPVLYSAWSWPWKIKEKVVTCWFRWADGNHLLQDNKFFQNAAG